MFGSLGEAVGGFVDNTLGTDFTGQGSPARARRAQEGASRDAMTSLAQGYDNSKKYFDPYNTDGLEAQNRIKLGDILKGDFTQNPGYQFRLNEGMKGIQSSAAARGNLNSGATLKALTRFGQDYASNEYDKAYNREYSRLSDLVNRGYNSAQNLASTDSTYHSNLANLLTGRGDAQAASYIAQGNQTSNFFDRLMSGAKEGAKYAMQSSDQRVKTNIQEVSKEDLNEMKKYLKAYAFNYIDDQYGKGDWIGVMAQDLEKSKLGKTLVEEVNGVKMVNMNKVLSMFLAVLASEGEV